MILWSICVLSLSAALSDVLDAFKLPENAARLSEARDTAGNDMLKGMQVVFPVVAQIQMDVIHKYGFLAEGDGETLTLSVCVILMTVLHTCIMCVEGEVGRGRV